MEKIEFLLDDDTTVDFYVLEQAKLSGNNYILVTDTKEGDGEALILKETGHDAKSKTSYAIVEDDDELSALAPLFESLMEDTEIQI